RLPVAPERKFTRLSLILLVDGSFGSLDNPPYRADDMEPPDDRPDPADAARAHPAEPWRQCLLATVCGPVYRLAGALGVEAGPAAAGSRRRRGAAERLRDGLPEAALVRPQWPAGRLPGLAQADSGPLPARLSE